MANWNTADGTSYGINELREGVYTKIVTCVWNGSSKDFTIGDIKWDKGSGTLTVSTLKSDRNTTIVCSSYFLGFRMSYITNL